MTLKTQSTSSLMVNGILNSIVNDTAGQLFSSLGVLVQHLHSNVMRTTGKAAILSLIWDIRAELAERSGR